MHSVEPGPTRTRSRRRSWPGRVARALALVVLVAVGVALVWLNRGPWWAWLAVGAVAVGALVVARLLRRRRWFVQAPATLAAIAVAALLAVILGPPVATRTISGERTEPVRTEQGDVVGVRGDDRAVDVFAGIPYAAPQVGELRWAAPRPAPKRAETLLADDFGPAAPQAEPSFATRALTQTISMPLEGTLAPVFPTSEDALRLNIWRSSSAAADRPAPVLVFIHGGGFVGGSGALPIYDGSSLAESGEAVVVTVNYRLGVFGFLAHDDLGDNAGNQGLLDQVAALEWIRTNIAAFGGDPGRVTIAGESAGSGSVCLLGAAPRAAGLFHGIIGQSGGCLGSAGDRERGDLYDSADRARSVADELSEALGGATLDEMRAMPADRILDAAAELSTHWFPTIDGELVERSPADVYADGDQHDVPLLLGSNADESSLALLTGVDGDPSRYEVEMRDEYGEAAEELLGLYPGDTRDEVVQSRLDMETERSMTSPMRAWGAAAEATGDSEVFMYTFSRTPPAPGLERFGAYHGAEVMYAFGTLGADGEHDYEDVDRRLSAEMQAYWLGFATTGDPNGPGRPAWPSLSAEPDRVLELGDRTEVVPRPAPERMEFWIARSGARG